MKCGKCGTELEGNALVCPFCGQAVSDEDRLREKYEGQQMTKRDFLQLPEMKSCRSNINTSGILLYVLGALNIVLQIVAKQIPVDGILIILLGLGIHLGKSCICSLLCLAYSVFNVIYVTMQTGRVSGWWIVVIAVYAVIYTFKYHLAWNRYKKDGTLPVDK